MNKRESMYWNVVKGFAIFLMLWGHCIQYCSLGEVQFFKDLAFKTIYTFHMPLFMLVSGYLFFYSFRKRDLKELLTHRIQGMLHPIVVATIFSNILMLLPEYILSDRFDILFGKLFLGIDYSLWFLWAVLISSVIVGIGCKATSKPTLQILIAAFGIFAALLVPQWNMTLFMYPYFVVGFFSGMYREKTVRVYKVVRYIALIVFPVLVSFYELKHYIYITPMYSEEIGLAASLEIAAFRCLIGFVGSIWMMAIIELVVRLGERVHLLSKLISALAALGKESLQIYCLSVPLLSGYLPHLYTKLMEPVGYNLFAQNMIVYDYVFTPLLTVAYAVFLYLAVGVLRKMKLHQLIFGR